MAATRWSATPAADPALNHVIEVTIANDGTYTVTLLDQFDHPNATIEDGLGITIPVSVSDGEFDDSDHHRCNRRGR